MRLIRLRNKQRRILTPHNESGRHVGFIEFLLCFVSVLLLSSGLILIIISLWSMIRKAPYYALLNVKVDVPYFALPAGILNCLSFWVAASLHNNRQNYRFLHLLIFLLALALALFITGTSLGLMSGSSKDILVNELTPLTWSNFNVTLVKAFSEYSSNENVKRAWDRVYRQLQCCGLNTISDSKMVPESCCFSKSDCNSSSYHTNGCLNAIRRDLIWQSDFLNIHCYIVIILDGIIIMTTGMVYYFSKSIRYVYLFS